MSGEPRDETAWLIEESFDGIPHYWNGMAFVRESLQAIRFVRQWDAGMVISALQMAGKAVEHMWSAP